MTATRGYTWAMPDYPITRPDTLFRVASVSKIFTCAAIEQLVAAGALSFETQAFPYLGVVRLPLVAADRDIERITVRHLATRQSGLKDDVEVDIRSIAKLFGTIIATDARPGAAIHLRHTAGRAAGHRRQLFQSRVHGT